MEGSELEDTKVLLLCTCELDAGLDREAGKVGRTPSPHACVPGSFWGFSVLKCGARSETIFLEVKNKGVHLDSSKRRAQKRGILRFSRGVRKPVTALP